VTRKAAWTPEKVRQRIRVGVVLRRVQNHALGKIAMSATELKAAEILLRKAVPDLKGVEHSGTVNHINYDAVVLGMLNGRSAEAGDAASAPDTTH
jgi:hypothetical protein